MALWLLFLWFWRAYLELGAQSSTLEFQAAALSYRYPALSGTVYFSGLRCFPNSFAPESAPWLPCSRRAPALWGARHEGELGFTWQGVWAAHCLRKHERQAASGTWSTQDSLEHPAVSRDPKQSPFLWEEWLTAAPATRPGVDFAFLRASEPLGSSSPCPSTGPARTSPTHQSHTAHLAWLLLWIPVCLPGKPHTPPTHRPQLHPQSLQMLKKELFLMKRLSGRGQPPIAGCWQKAGLERRAMSWDCSLAEKLEEQSPEANSRCLTAAWRNDCPRR